MSIRRHRSLFDGTFDGVPFVSFAVSATIDSVNRGRGAARVGRRRLLTRRHDVRARLTSSHRIPILTYALMSSPHNPRAHNKTQPNTKANKLHCVSD